MSTNDHPLAVDDTRVDANADVPRLARGRGAKPLRLPVWKCPRCGARKRLRGARRGEQEAE